MTRKPNKVVERYARKLAPLTTDVRARQNMDVDTIRKRLQSILGDGLAIIVGSGLSAAEGIPGMSDLTRHLLQAVPQRLPPDYTAEWEAIATRLRNGAGLESALSGQKIAQETHVAITTEVALCIRAAERSVFSAVISGTRTLRFSRFAKALPPTSQPVTCITTNYDRLIELGCEAADQRVETMFVGDTLGKFDPRECGYGFCRGIRRRQGRLVLEYAPRLRVLKPHGSLDWYAVNGRPMRCSPDIEAVPLIVAPGDSKYRAGYDEPFDMHREASNREIDRATRYLIVGYGFNDDHLQTHLARNLRDGKQALVLTKVVTSSAESCVKEFPNTISVCAHTTRCGVSLIRDADGTRHEADGDYWDLGYLAKEVFI